MLFATTLLAQSQDIEKEIYKTILHALFPQKHIIIVWSDSDQELFIGIPHVVVIYDQKRADILLLKKRLPHPSPKLRQKLLFVRSYTLLKIYKDWAIGGFFWQKGRPNILFFKPNLLKYHITLPQSFQKYVEDR